MTNEELINQRKKEIVDLTSRIDKSKINYNLPMGSWVSNKESEISDRERMTRKMTIEKTINELKTQIRYYKDFWGADASDYVIDTFNTAISTMRKYQKIEEIIADWKNDGGAFEMSELYWLKLISEVIEDGQ